MGGLTASMHPIPPHPVLLGPVSGLPTHTHTALGEPLSVSIAVVFLETFKIDMEKFSVKFLRFALVGVAMELLFLPSVFVLRSSAHHPAMGCHCP